MTAAPLVDTMDTSVSRTALPRLRPIALLVLLLCARALHAAEEAPAEPVREEPGVVPRPTREGVPTLQMSTDYAHPALGFGTYAPISQVDARGIRVEPFVILSGIQAGVGYDSNVALQPGGNTHGSMFTTVSPSVAIGLDGALQRYYLTYRGRYGVYASDAQADYADHNLALTAVNAWTSRLRSSASYEYIRGHTPRGLTLSSTSSADHWMQHTVRASVNYGSAGAQGELQGEAGWVSRRYTSANTSATGEYDRTDLAGTFYYRVAPKTRALFRVSYADVQHPNDASFDSTEVAVLVGATWEALAKTTGRASVGYTSKDFSSPTRSDFTGYRFDVGALWTPQSQTSFDISGRRFLSETLEPGADFLVNTVGNVAWNQLWQRDIRSTVNYSYGRIEHQGIARTDTYQTFAARVSYGVAKNLRLGAELRYDSRSSDAAGGDYSRSIFLLTAETAL